MLLKRDNFLNLNANCHYNPAKSNNYLTPAWKPLLAYDEYCDVKR